MLARGIHWFTAAEAAELTALPHSQVHGGLKRLSDQGRIFSPARGFYVPIPPEFRLWGSVPAPYFLDAMMQHLSRRYYVGLLSAAEMHGLAHQRPRVFQVMVDRQLQSRRRGRTDLRFFMTSAVATAATAVLPTPTGTITVGTPETTVLDLAGHPAAAGGLDNVATVIAGFAEEGLLDPDALRVAARERSASAVRRAGWILARFGGLDLSRSLAREGIAPTRLDPSGGRRGAIDPVWQVILNTDVEPDQ